MNDEITEANRCNQKDLLMYLLPTEGPGRDDMRQLYSWAFDDAWKAQEEWEAKYGPNVQGRGPFFRWIGTQELRELYEAYQTGNVAAIIEAFYVCSLNSLPIPRWCEYAYLTAYRKVKQYKAKSWDDVFGRPHKKGVHLGTERQRREYSIRVYRRIEDIRRGEPNTPIDAALFERVGREFGIGGKTLTAEYYYKQKVQHRKMDDNMATE